jgi:biopolymer transport protein ExbD
LSSARKQARKSVLVIRADETVPHGLVVKVMDLAKRAGIDNLAIATRPYDT